MQKLDSSDILKLLRDIREGYLQNVSPYTEDNFPSFQADGQLQDSGYNGLSFAPAPHALDSTSYHSAPSGYTGNDAQNLMYFNIAGLPVPITAAAKVGMSKTTPATKFHIYESNANTGTAGITMEQAGAGDSVLSFLIPGENFKIGIDNSDSDKFKISNGTLGTNDRLTIDSSGNIGIGTSTPQRQMVISHDGNNPTITGLDANIALLLTSAGYTGMSINSANTDISFIHFSDPDRSKCGSIDYDHSLDQFEFFTDGNQVVTIDSNGQVGIAITPSGAMLHIDQASSTGAKVCAKLDQGDADFAIIDLVGTSGSGNTIDTRTTSGATTNHVKIKLNGTDAWVAVSTNAPS